jgi:hypothetical protein
MKTVIDKMFGTICGCFVIFLLLAVISRPSFAEENKFFSYKRFLLNQNFISSIPGKNELERDVKRFSELYTDAFYALSENNLNNPEAKLIKARGIWP